MHFEYWIPVPDRRKPNLPYAEGLELEIRPHTPPRPFGNKYKPASWPRMTADDDELRNETASSWTLSHPPLDTGAVTEGKSRRLKITGQIACEDGRGPQVVRCILVDDGGDDDGEHAYVAKIYDPLYYHFGTAEDDLSRPQDVAFAADRDYSEEAAAYAELKQSGVDGELVPRYHGAWTFDMSLHREPHALRPVRMILIDWVPGRSMRSVMKSADFARMTPQHRLDILGAAMEVYCRVDFHGVHHGDFAPRNVLLIGDDMDIQVPRVMLIDFGLSAVMNDPNCRRKSLGTKLPVNPRDEFWYCCPSEFEGWCPPPHCHEKPVWSGWLRRRYEGDPRFVAEPPDVYTMLNHYDDPVEDAEPMEDRDYYPRMLPPED